MDLLSLALSLSLPMQGGQFTGDYSFDLTPTIGIHAPTGLWGAGATTLPGVVLYDPAEVERLGAAGEGWDEIVRHELMHSEQQQALGPAFWLAYTLTGGQAFEPHKEITFVPSTTAAWGMAPRVESDYSRMWMPDDTTRGRYPLFRMAREGGGTRLQFMPGYPELLRLGNE
jgi:hypothetical protein